MGGPDAIKEKFRNRFGIDGEFFENFSGNVAFEIVIQVNGRQWISLSTKHLKQTKKLHSPYRQNYQLWVLWATL